MKIVQFRSNEYGVRKGFWPFYVYLNLLYTDGGAPRWQTIYYSYFNDECTRCRLKDVIEKMDRASSYVKKKCSKYGNVVDLTKEPINQ